MKPQLAASVTLAALAASIPAAPVAAAPAHAASQCQAGEAIVYSCRFGRKVGSLCAGGGNVHYRFGPLGQPEIALSAAPGWTNLRFGMVTGQQGGSQHHVRFTSGGTHYVIYHGVDGQLADRPGRTYSGIAVVAGLEGERELATFDCRRGATIDPRFEDAAVEQAPAHIQESLSEPANSPFDRWY